MAKSKLYEYVIIHHPKTKKDVAGNEEDVKSKLVVDVTRILAPTADQVSILAARSIPDEYLDKLDQVEIIVRPFS